MGSYFRAPLEIRFARNYTARVRMMPVLPQEGVHMLRWGHGGAESSGVCSVSGWWLLSLLPCCGPPFASIRTMQTEGGACPR